MHLMLSLSQVGGTITSAVIRFQQPELRGQNGRWMRLAAQIRMLSSGAGEQRPCVQYKYSVGAAFLNLNMLLPDGPDVSSFFFLKRRRGEKGILIFHFLILTLYYSLSFCLM